MMTEPYKTVVNFNLVNFDNEQFHRILKRVTTSIVNLYFSKNFNINKIYEHVKFIDGNQQNLVVHNLVLVE